MRRLLFSLLPLAIAACSGDKATGPKRNPCDAEVSAAIDAHPGHVTDWATDTSSTGTITTYVLWDMQPADESFAWHGGDDGCFVAPHTPWW